MQCSSCRLDGIATKDYMREGEKQMRYTETENSIKIEYEEAPLVFIGVIDPAGKTIFVNGMVIPEEFNFVMVVKDVTGVHILGISAECGNFISPDDPEFIIQDGKEIGRKKEFTTQLGEKASIIIFYGHAYDGEMEDESEA